MAGKRSFDAQLAALEVLRQQPREASVKGLRKALGHRNNYLAAKAAELVRELGMGELLPELLAAFDLFFADPVKRDPQCWAKNALSRALAALECQDAAVFLRGMRHVQLEPVWGGSSDTAGPMRATCALALLQCRSLSDHELLSHLVELFADQDKSVRAEVVRAVAQVGSSQAALLLRLRAVLAGDEPEILGACYSGILSIEGSAAIPWLARFLEAGNDIAAEAALAIAQDRSPEALRALRERFDSTEGRRDDNPWFHSVLLSAIALTRQEAAFQFLLDLVRTLSAESEAAVRAVVGAAPPPEIIQQLEQMVSKTPRLARAFAAHRSKD